jgi:hypothetical protein
MYINDYILLPEIELKFFKKWYEKNSENTKTNMSADEWEEEKLKYRHRDKD